MKKLFLLTLVAALLLCAGCKKDPTPTTVPTSPVETDPSTVSTTAPEITEPSEATTPPSTQPNVFVKPDYDYYLSLLDSSEGNIWIRRALGCVFTSAEDLNLEQFFLNGISDISWENVSSETADFLMAQGFEQSTELQGMPVKDMDQVLKTCFGLSLTDVETAIPESWVYVSADNCYYSNHHPRGTVSDIEVTLIEETRDNTVQIFYNIYAGEALDSSGNPYYEEEMLLTLRYMSDGTLQVVSNAPVPSK